MRKVFIVNQHQHRGLLNFTQAKVFFDANNRYVDWVDDIETVENIEQIGNQPGIIISSGECVTTNFRTRLWDWNKQNFCIGDSELISFTAEYSYEIHKRPPFEQGSKQLYILENLYRTVLRSRRLVYLDNTEDYNARRLKGSRLYGLASGWKTLRLARDGEFNTVVVYDNCRKQLDFQQELHSRPYIADHITTDQDFAGSNQVPNDVKLYWPTWHKTPVRFEFIDLFDIPRLENNSAIWISNVFCYEPNIFEKGWEACKTARTELQNANPSCTIFEY